MALIKDSLSNSGKVVKQMELSYTANENVKWFTYFGK